MNFFLIFSILLAELSILARGQPTWDSPFSYRAGQDEDDLFLVDPDYPEKILLSYTDMNAKRIFGSRAQCQCPNAKLGHYAGCVQYDQTHQASNIVEAMKNFRDLTNPDDHSSEERIAYRAGDPPPSYTCTNMHCKACMDKMIHRFESKKWLPPQVASLLRQKFAVRNGDRNRVLCNRFNFQRNMRNVDIWNPWLMNSTTLNKAKGAAQFIKATAPEAIGNNANENTPDMVEIVHLNEGIRFVMHCVSRGEIIAEKGWMRLCDVCWAWRQLPRGYHPRIVNELICRPQDDKCLGGWASCKQEYMDMEVYTKIGPKDSDIEKTKVSVPSGCICIAKKGNPLEQLIKR